MSIDFKEPIKNITPNGVIRFFQGLNIDPAYENTIWFPSRSAQTTWFTNKASSTLTFGPGTDFAMAIKSPFQYIFKIPTRSNNLFTYDYMMVQPDITGETGANMSKILYFFITGVDYSSPNTTTIYAELDKIQTFLFDADLGTQQVSRCHFNKANEMQNDLLNFLPEEPSPGITEVGNTILNQSLSSGGGEFEPNILIITTKLPIYLGIIPDNKYDPIQVPTYIFNGYDILGTDRHPDQFYYLRIGGSNIESTFAQLMEAIDYIQGFNAIKAIYAVPRICCGKDVATLYQFSYDPVLSDIPSFLQNCHVCVPDVRSTTTYLEGRALSLNNYTPMNKKVLNKFMLRYSTTSGQSYVIDSNNSGFLEANHAIPIVIKGYCGNEPELYIKLSTYNEDSVNLNTINPPILSVKNFPSISVYNSDQADAYNMGLMQQKVGMFAQIAQYGATAGMSAYQQSVDFTGSRDNMIEFYDRRVQKANEQGNTQKGLDLMSKFNKAYSTLESTAEIQSLSSIPNVVGAAASQFVDYRNMEMAEKTVPQNMVGSSQSSILWVDNNIRLCVELLTPPELQLKAYDQALSKFGYNFGGLTVNIGTGGYMCRKHFTYIKTIGAKISGNLGIFKSEIENIYNKGIRFWRATSLDTYKMGSYPDSLLADNTYQA